MAQVMKFGGSCLAGAAGLALTAQRIREAGGPVVVVLSAFQGVTEQLLELADQAKTGPVDTGPLAKFHRGLLAHVSPAQRVQASDKVEVLLAELDRLVAGIGYLREVSARTRDRISSLGERLALALVSGYLTGCGLEVRAFEASELGLRSDGHFGNARLLDEAAEGVRAALRGVPVAVVPGFIGVDDAGELNTLGRGGSDYTATWIAATLGCPCVLWKDVGGLRTADPKVVPQSRILPRLDYLDALELAHYGSKVIHEKALAPAMKAAIPVEIRGFEDPTQRTVISGEPSRPLCVAALRETVMVDIHGFGEDILPSLASLLTEMSAVRVSPLLLTEASPRGETSILLRPSDKTALASALTRLSREAKVELREDLGMVSIIGRGMTGRVGFAAEVFHTLAAEGINVVAIAQTASERNVSVVLEAGTVQRAAVALHRRFIEQAE